MRHAVFSVFAVALLLSSTASAAPSNGYTKQIVNQNQSGNAQISVWAPVANFFTDSFKDQVPGEIVNAVLRAVKESTNEIVRLHTDSAGNLKVVITGASGTAITGPLGSRPAAQSVSTAPPTDAQYRVSRDSNANLVTNPIWTQISQDGATAVGAANPLPISATMAANAVGNPLYAAVSATAAANTLANPMFFRISADGTNAMSVTHPLIISKSDAQNAVGNPLDVELGDGTDIASILAAVSDGVSLTENALVTFSALGLYNGATLDMARSGASGGLLVEVVTRAWEDLANAWVRSWKAGTATYTPAKTSTANIGTALVTVLASYEILGYPNCTVTLRNTSANAFLNAEIFVSADNAGTCGDVNWAALTWVACDALATTRTCTYSLTANSYRYVCVQVAGLDASRVTTDAWITCNAN